MRKFELFDDMSPAELSAHIRSIGLDNIKLYADTKKLIATFSDYELLDEITANKKRDVKGMIKKLYVSLITTDSAECDEAIAESTKLLAVL